VARESVLVVLAEFVVAFQALVKDGLALVHRAQLHGIKLELRVVALRAHLVNLKKTITADGVRGERHAK
jgi:hypothetical protein